VKNSKTCWRVNIDASGTSSSVDRVQKPIG
jgi:hypothetical protein